MALKCFVRKIDKSYSYETKTQGYVNSNMHY